MNFALRKRNGESMGILIVSSPRLPRSICLVSALRAGTIFPGLILLLLFCSSMFGQADYRIETGDFVREVILSGSLRAQKAERFIVPRSNIWQIQIKWMAREGDYVKPGDPVIRFDTSSLVSEIENKEESLQVKKEQKIQKLAEKSFKEFELQVKLKQAEINYEKAKLDASVPKGIFSNYDYDQKQLEKKKSAKALKKAEMEKQVKTAALKTEIKKIEIEIAEQEAEIKKYRDILERLNLEAKTAGSFVYGVHPWQGRKIQVGDTVPSSSTIATIPDNSSLQVEAWLNETDINRVKVGQKADMVLDAYPDRQFTGAVKQILNNAEKREKWGKAHYFWVLIELDGRDLTIMKPGMSVKCRVRTAEFPRVLLVPLQAAYYDGGDFWIQPAGKEALKVKPLGFNETHLALNSGSNISEGLRLQTVDPAKIKSSKEEK